jgi:hypothetical protein
VKFKSKIFSFGHIVVEGNKLTHYQISEPLSSTSSASAANPAPYGYDFYGEAIKDPLPDTLLDPTTGQLLSANQNGTPTLLDKWTIEKPDLGGAVEAHFFALRDSRRGAPKDYHVSIANHSNYALNGAQIVLDLPDSAVYGGIIDDKHTVIDHKLIVTLGRVERGEKTSVEIPLDFGHGIETRVTGVLRSATAQPITVERDE